MTTTVLIAYKITGVGAEIVGEYSFAPAGDGHDARQAANQALAAAASHLETVLGLRTERVVLFGGKTPEHNADRLASARAGIIENFAH